jgi:uncharacterized protein (TIGR03083 family)
MDNARFLSCLEADYRRLREVADGHLETPVPTCPDWTIADLTRHVAEVYLHKVECMREGRPRKTDWPPPGLADEEPIALLDRSYTALVTELTTRNPDAPGGTWYDPDPTVGFWFRRMAHETVIHRIDAELGAGADVAPVPDDLATDGIDELLKVFLAYNCAKWPEDFTEALKDSPGLTFLILAGKTSWLAKTSPATVSVAGGPAVELTAAGTPDIVVTGSPAAVLRWGWNREARGVPSPVTIQGSADALAEIRRCLYAATQ